MATGGKGKLVGISGINPWNANNDSDSCESFGLTIRESEDDEYEVTKNTQFVFTPDTPEDVKALIAIYEFYDMCRYIECNKRYSNKSLEDCFDDNYDFQIDSVTVAIATVSYFGTDKVRKTLDKYKKEIPRTVWDLLNRTLKMPIKKTPNSENISFVFQSDTPFPEFVPII